MLRTPVCFRTYPIEVSPQFQFSLSAVTLGIYLGGYEQVTLSVTAVEQQ